MVYVDVEVLKRAGARGEGAVPLQRPLSGGVEV
jgi:hypothetical protein